MTNGYIIENEDFVTEFKKDLKSVLLFNHEDLNILIHHFIVFNPTKENLKLYSDLVGVWKIKSK